jgi:hypothetical protein
MAGGSVTESAFSIVEQLFRNVKRWRGGAQRGRWAEAGLSAAEKLCRQGQGYRRIHPSSGHCNGLQRICRRLSNGAQRRRVGYSGIATFNGLPGVR